MEGQGDGRSPCQRAMTRIAVINDARGKEAEVYISQKALLILAKCKYINL